MPSALVAALSAPIREVQAMVGPGWSGAPGDPAVVLAGARDRLRDVSADARRTWIRADASWSGAAADAAAGVSAATATAIEALADRAEQLRLTARTASDAVARAHQRLRAIVDRFEARAAALEAVLGTSEVSEELLAEARRSLAEAIAVVEELRTELDGYGASLPAEPASATRAPANPPATTPAGWAGPSMPPLGPASGGSPLSTLASGTSGLGDLAASLPEAPTPDAATFGEGVAVRLPDGSTTMAPNPVAASAVRHALTQLGVPYDWGGTTPGVGLDCSGLTQWAYSEAGLNIPRLAQDQDIGAAVGAGNLRPGDLAVWDGHVAMVVGNGQMIEAGDPVQLSPIRTDNAGQGFQGFWRPTA